MNLSGFFLGLSSGGACLASCTPVLVPYLLGEGKGFVPNLGVTGRFLLGRLMGYLLIGILAWGIGSTVFPASGRRNLAVGISYILFSALLITYGFFRTGKSACSQICKPVLRTRAVGFLSAWLPEIAGFQTGLSFCPPVALAVAGAASQVGLLQAIFYFFSFFIGTSLLFVAVPVAGLFNRSRVITAVGKMAAGLMGIYYFYSGIILVLEGLKL